MHPALSVIFFTTLSGAGYGLLAWLGLSLLMLHTRADLMPVLQPMYAWGLLAGLALSTVGLLSSLAHLGQPMRAWRALSQWRTSWLSREGVLALAVPLPALALLCLLLLADPGPGRAIALGALGLLLAALSLATVACTAMIYASLPPIPAWRHPLVVPVYLLFALLTGLALLFWLMTALLPFAPAGAGPLLTLAVLGVLLAGCKLAYWHRIDRQALPATRAGAVGLPGREASVFERPHTEASFITREMVFVLARRHARALRAASILLLAVVPLAAWGLAAAALLAPGGLLALTGLALLAGAFAERWLFFAQARHMVSLYY